MKTQSITVVMPYYNDSSVVERAIRSIFDQKLKPKEIIIIDDCSKDSSKLISIVNIYNNMHDIVIRVYRNDENKNGAYSRNLGISKASYKYIALLDSDDYWDSLHLEESISFLIKSEAEFVYSNFIKGETYIKATNISDLQNKFDILFYNAPQTNSFVFNRVIFEDKKVFFDEKLRRHQDWQFFILALEKDIVIKYLDKYTSYYCESPRPQVERVNYESMFYFWNVNRNKFTKKLLKNFLMRLCAECCKSKGYSQMINILFNNDFQEIMKKNRIYFMLLEKENYIFAKCIYYFFYDPINLIKKFFKLK